MLEYAVNRIKVFIETTIFNRYFEEHREYSLESKILFDRIKLGYLEAYTSAYVVDELSYAPSPKKEGMLKLIQSHDVIILDKNKATLALADFYIHLSIIPQKFRLDGVHIATATVHNLDCIISLNFQHINKLKVKNALEPVNAMMGYSSPVICTPGEVIYD
jgi:predicted nucleic acid-binding protein